MGPFLLVDKSFIQSLSEGELDFLDRHYTAIITPILIREICANLLKYPEDESLSKQKVSLIAKKTKGFNARTICQFEQICVNDLVTGQVELKPQIPRIGGKEFITEDGSKGIIFEESYEDKLLTRWANSVFKDEDLKAAENHIKVRNYDLEKSQINMAKLYPINARYKSLDEITIYIDSAFLNYPFQWHLIESQMNMLCLEDPERTLIAKRWKIEGQSSFKNFSPYAFFCYRLGSIFWLGVTSGVIATSKKKKAIIDHQYFFYAPFVQAFCSNDKFHNEFSKYFIRMNQDFIWGEDLKKDLRDILLCYTNMTDEEKMYFEKNFGHYPPPIPNSITNLLWQKHMRPWTPKSGNLAIEMSDEKKKELAAKINNIFEAYKKS